MASGPIGLILVISFSGCSSSELNQYQFKVVNSSTIYSVYNSLSKVTTLECNIACLKEKSCVGTDTKGMKCKLLFLKDNFTSGLSSGLADSTVWVKEEQLQQQSTGASSEPESSSPG